ncbi:MAG: phosphatidate cytidylyltransferase [Pirellulales bacterium]
MLRTRLILGTIFVAALVALCWLDYHASRPGIYLLPLAVVLSLAGAGELLAMWRQHGEKPQPLPWVVYSGTLITVLAAGTPVWLPPSWNGGSTIGQLGWLAIGLAVSLLLAIVGEMRRYDRPGNATTSLALTCFTVLYVGGLTGLLVQLRLFGLNVPSNNARLGMLALVSMIIIVKMSDIGQYTAGRMFGSRKLAPSISPGKTWEGVLGGMLFAVIGGFVSHWLGQSAFNAGPSVAGRFLPGDAAAIGVAFLYPLMIAAAGIVGDLAESMLKRDAGVKDSSTWLPGFGGVLDLLDSLLGAAPVAYLFWALHIVGP